MRRSTLSGAVVATAALVLGGVATAASAHAVPAKAGMPNAAVSHSGQTSSKASPVPAAVTGYQQVSSTSYTDAAGTQSAGNATCPTGTQVVGGGVVIAGGSLSENLNGSAPLNSTTWRAYVNNSGAANGSFTVYAICAAHVTGYVQVQGTQVDNPSGTQVSATAACPAGTVPLGGGGLGSSFDVAVNLNSTLPQSSGWRVDVNNNSASGDSATAYAICAKAPPKYAQVSSKRPTTLKPGTQKLADAKCPRNTVVFGGGVLSSTGSVLVNVNTSEPNDTGAWRAYENNGNTLSNTITAYAVCGKVTS